MNIWQAIWGFFAEYGSVVFGLVVGTLAHFGRMLSEGRHPTLSEAFGYILQLGLIGMVAVVSTRLMGVTDDDMRALATAILAISAQEVVRYLKANGWGPWVKAVAPEETLTGEMREAEQKAKAIRYLEENDLLEEALQRLRGGKK